MSLRSIPLRVAIADTRSARPVEKGTDPFYNTPEHQAWRAEVIRRADGTCQWPGCGRKERRMFADHVNERQDGGADLDPDNGQCLCGKHHSLKTASERAKRMVARPSGARDHQGG